MRTLFLLLTIGLLRLALSAEAASPFPASPTLASLVREALRNNPDIQATQSQWDASKARVPQAGSLDDPQVQLMWMGIPNSREMSTTPNDIEYRLSMTLPFPGKRALRMELAQKDAAISREDITNRKRQIVQQVQTAYFDLYLARKKLEVNAANIERVRALLETAQSRYGVGKALLSDVLTLQSELAKRLNNAQTFRDEEQAVVSRLNLLLNRPADTPVKTEGELNDSSAPQWTEPLERLEAVAIERRSEARQSGIVLQQSGTAIHLAKAQYKPDFMLMLKRDPGQVPAGGFDAMVAINLPFLFRKKYDYGLKEAQESAKAAKATQEAVRNAILTEVRAVYANLQTARRLASLHRTVLIPQAQDIYEVALVAYQTGETDFPRVANALIAVEETTLNYYDALTTTFKAMAEMERVAALTEDLP